MESCKLVQKNSKWVWKRLGRAGNLGMKMGEESITDSFVFNMKKWATKNIDVYKFTKPKEFKTGADWELWLTGPSRKWLGIRVQAKIIDFKSKEYKQLYYVRRDGTHQVQALIDAATENYLFPLYCMYSNWNRGNPATPSVCGAYKSTVYHYGTSILSPYVVKEMHKTSIKPHIYNIIMHLKPMHCIFCCTAFGRRDLPARAFYYLQHIMLEQIHDAAAKKFFEDELLKERFLKKDPPDYVDQLVLGDHDSLLKNEIFRMDEALKRVIVLKEHESE